MTQISSAKLGKQGERIAHLNLNLLQIKMILKIPNSWRIIGKTSKRGVYKCVAGNKIEGDFRGILPNGRSVLIEVKRRNTKTLSFSALANHQIARLDQHSELNGLSLLVWIRENDLFGLSAYIMKWPIVGFESGSTISVSKADALYRQLQEEMNADQFYT